MMLRSGEKATSQQYVEEQAGNLRVAGTRVSLDSLVYAFHRGASAETIQSDWPTLSLEQVYGAITYYLAHKTAVDKYLARADQEHADAVAPLSQTAPDLYQRLQSAGSEMASRKR